MDDEERTGPGEPQGPTSLGDERPEALAEQGPAAELAPEAELAPPEAEAPAGRLASWMRWGLGLWGTRKWLLTGLAVGGLLIAAVGLLLPEGKSKGAPAVVKSAAPVADERVRTLDPFIFVEPTASEDAIFKVALAIEFTDVEAARRFDGSLSAARRDLYYFLSREVAGKSLPAQTAELQEGVRQVLNARLGPGQVVKVYFRELLAV
jgi:hypothetical protein